MPRRRGAIACLNPKQMGCTAWWDGELSPMTLSGNKISAWADFSGNGRHLVQATAQNQPTTGKFNGVQCTSWDGANTKMSVTSAGIFSVTGSTIMAVVQPANANAKKQILVDQNGTVYLRAYQTGLVGMYFSDGTLRSREVSYGAGKNYILTALHDGGGISLGVNGVYTNWTACGTLGAIHNTINVGWNNFETAIFNGLIGAIAIFNRCLKVSERQNLEAYFRRRFNF